MHAHLITAQPTRWQRCTRTVRRWAPRLLVAAGLLVLGLLVFALRTTRALTDVATTFAARIEYAAAVRAGKPPLGQVLGAGLTAAFAAEFRRAFYAPPAS